MEGVPRLYMIGLPAKQCVEYRKPEFTSTLNHYILQIYKRDPDLYLADMDTLIGLRQSAMDALMSTVCTVDNCTVLKRYYAHLVRLTDKFPRLLQHQSIKIKESSDDKVLTEGKIPPLIFTWKQALGGKRKTKNILEQQKSLWRIGNSDFTKDAADVSGDIAFEMRCVLYNIGAAHSRLAAAQDRSPPLELSSSSTDLESSSNSALKIACTHLQCAAWAFEQLLGAGGTDDECTKWHHRQQPPVTSRSVLEFAYNVTLAQAQECILEKSMMDGRKPVIIAKVSAMICEYFAGAVNAIQQVECEPYSVSPNRIQKWKLYSEFKCRYYGAVTALFQGQHVQDQLQQMGIRVSYYRRAVNLLGRATQISENGVMIESSNTKDDDSADDDYYYYLNSEDKHSVGQSAAKKELEMRRDTLTFAMDVAAAKWRAAKSENELIYHEPVVPVLSDDDDSDCMGTLSSSSNRCQLERVKGASLVKPIGFSIDDPELLTVVVVNNNEPSGTNTTTTLFRDLVPSVTRSQAAMYRNEKQKMENDLQIMCQEADNQLTTFSDSLHLECLEMYKNNSDDIEKSNVIELPQQLINCCAAYQAILQQQRQEKAEVLSNDDEVDQLDVDMARLSAAVQAVDSMLDEIDRLLKIEELGDSEYQRTVGRSYDYSAGLMRELRREASRYREAHAGRARDSWVTLSRAVRDRRRRDLELLKLPPSELAARLPPARPTKTMIASEVAASGATDSIPFVGASSNSSDQNDSESDNGNDERSWQLQKESLERLDRLNMVVNKMQEVREQRQILLSRLREKMNQEDKDAAAAGQDDSDVLGEVRGSKVDVMAVVTKKLNDRYGNLVNMIELNLSAQQNVLDAVRTSYARAAPERRAYSNAMQRRRTLVTSLLEAYNSFAIANGGTPVETGCETMLASPTSGLLPDTVLAEKCAKGLDFYQRLLTNVSKLLQRVKGTCQVQTEQRDQIIKQHRDWETTTQSDDDPSGTIGGLDNLLAAVSTVDDQDHHQDDLAAVIKSFGSSFESNKYPTTIKADRHWDQQHNHHRRLSPLGSEQQQQQNNQQYRYSQIQSPSTTASELYKYYDTLQSSTMKAYSGHDNIDHISTAQQQQQQPLPPVNSTTTSISSQLPSSSSSSSSVPFNYLNYQLPTAISAVNQNLSSPSYNNVPATNSGIDISTSTMMNALRLSNNNINSQNVSQYNQSIGSSISDSDGKGGFTNAAAAVAALQRPLPIQYNSYGGRSISNIGGKIGYGATGAYGYNYPTPILPSQQQRFYSQQPQHQYAQQMSTVDDISAGSAENIARLVLLGQQVPKSENRSTPTIQTSLPLSLPSIPITEKRDGITAAVTSSVNSGGNISAAINFVPQLPLKQHQFYQPLTQQPQLFQQQSQLPQQQPQSTQQQPQLFQQQSQLSQQQPQLTQQQPQLLQQKSQLPQQQPHLPQQPQLSQQQQFQLYSQQQSQIYQQQQQQHSQISQQSPQVYQHAQQLQQPQQQQQQSQQQQPQQQQPQPQQQQPQQQPLNQFMTTGNNPICSYYYMSMQQQQTSQLYQPQHQQQPTTVLTTPILQQLSSMSNNGSNDRSYSSTPQNDNANILRQYFTAFESVPRTLTEKEKLYQLYHQQIPAEVGGLAPLVNTNAPAVSLLDEDWLVSGPPPIKPEIVGSGGSSNESSTTPLSSTTDTNDQCLDR